MSDFGDSSDAKLINKAIAYSTRLLASREYSRKSLTLKLRSKGYSIGQSNAALDYLVENNWQSDQRFCESFIRRRVLKGQGETRISYELSQHGLQNAMISKAFEEEPVDWQALCDQVCDKKSASLVSGEPLKNKIKLERFLKYRGFSSEQIRNSISKVNLTRSISGDYDQ